MELGQIFHLTPLVTDLDAATARFEQIFGPLVWYRGYEPVINNREAALMVVGDFVIEPMMPRAPFDDSPPTSHFRYVDRFGEGIHSLAVYATDLDEIDRRLRSQGVRTTDGGMPTTVFTHPKDFPGLIEFFDPEREPHPESNPRRHPDWSAAYWRDMHPLRMQFVSHVTLIVRDHHAAAEAYAGALDCTILPSQPSRTSDCESSFVTFGSDTMIELAQPNDDQSAAAEVLTRVGESWWGATFAVHDLDDARTFLSADHIDAPMTVDHNTIRIDRDWMFGAEYAFTDQPLTGDPRVS